jgi:hypothetical protein
MIDNIKNIIPLLLFQKGNFYEVRVESPSNKMIKHYMIDSLEDLLSQYDEMKLLADNFNTEVYIKLGAYSKEKLGFKILEVLSHKLQIKDLDYYDLLLQSINDMNTIPKYWIVDVNVENVSNNDILRIKTVINDCEPNGRNVIADIPTPNGIHIVTKPFNTNQFLTHQDVYYKVEVKKNNPTILYSNLNKNL